MNKTIAYRASILHFLDNPKKTADAYEYFEDGLLIVSNGKIQQVGNAEILLKNCDASIPIEHYPNGLIMPGFIDLHIHAAQMNMIASYGEHLMSWLEKYTFPMEAKFSDHDYAHEHLQLFLNELLRNGTTTALIYTTIHENSVNALFEEASKIKMRLIAGKVLSDQNVPNDLRESVDKAGELSENLINKWNGKDRINYALTPRFAPTSSEELMKLVQELKQDHPSVYLQTHLAENASEIELTKKMFPWAKDYLEVYEHYNWLGEKSIFAHAIHCNENNFKSLAQTNSKIAFCPTSNLFLGSGLFNYELASNSGVDIGFGTDVGAGTSFSMLTTLSEAYKVMQLQNQRLCPFEAFYKITLGGARALSLDSFIGNFETDKEADFVILNLGATLLLTQRMKFVESLSDILFSLMILGDDRVVEKTIVYGESV